MNNEEKSFNVNLTLTEIHMVLRSMNTLRRLTNKKENKDLVNEIGIDKKLVKILIKNKISIYPYTTKEYCDYFFGKDLLK